MKDTRFMQNYFFFFLFLNLTSIAHAGLSMPSSVALLSPSFVLFLCSTSQVGSQNVLGTITLASLARFLFFLLLSGAHSLVTLRYLKRNVKCHEKI